MSKDVLYFGPSNGVGPGSLWRKGDNGGYFLRWLLSDASAPSDLIKPGENATCTGTHSETLDIKADVFLQSEVTPFSGSVAADFKRAKSITTKVGTWRIDNLKEGPYLAWLKQLPADSAYRTDVEKNGRLILLRAVRVSGFSAVLEFESNVGVELKAKYKDGPQQFGEVGAQLNFHWNSDTTLEVTSNTDFYIAGEMGRYSEIIEPNHITSVPSIVKVPTKQGDTVGYERATKQPVM